jgi:predicted TIM-barrel fold metal-dependent hydrolase
VLAQAGSGRTAPTGIVDTNVNVFDWPFRKLKYRDTPALVAKLKQHRVIEAWAGSFEALFHKDINGVNERLSMECREKGGGLLRPFGTVNLAWADWEEDLRRCHEGWKMPGVRLYPGYQPFDLTHPDLKRLVAMTRERGLLLQIVFGMEDTRVHHPIINVGPVLAMPLVPVLKAEPQARVQLLHFTGNLQGTDLRALMNETSATIDISRWEGNGAVGRMIGTAPGTEAARVPVDRVVFGSHAPYFPLETAILKLIESPASKEQLHAIMQGNARRLLPSA